LTVDAKQVDHGFQFTVTRDLLPLPASPVAGDDSAARKPGIVVKDLPDGRYLIDVDGKHVPGHAHGGKAAVVAAVDVQQTEEVRSLINAKNRQYFYRWRPQNETYLFGFRKHEQGQNAREIPLFDPIVAELEAKIATLRKPKPHTYKLIREGEVAR